MMSTAERTDGMRDVNGAAMDASPSFTLGVSMSSAPSISAIICANPGAPIGPPLSRRRISARRFVSAIIRCVAAFIALNAAHCSPAAVLLLTSSSNHCF